MSNKTNRRGFRNKQYKEKSDKDGDGDPTTENETNPILLAFKMYSKELDDKNDRYERIIKCSRDITIESKRIIFLLHTIDKKANKEEILEQAKNRISNLCEVNFYNIAKELFDLDAFQYLRAYSPGIQEFIEALTYYEYLSNRKLCNWEDVQQRLTYEVEDSQKEIPTSEILSSETIKTEKMSPDEEKQCIKNSPVIRADEGSIATINKYSCFVEPTEFILGLSDLTGELLKRCIGSLGYGDIVTCFNCCNNLKLFYKFFISINNNNRNRELSRKIFTLKQSLLKCETVCYNVKVRGGEAAKWGLSGNNTYAQDVYGDEDEGYF